MGHFAFSFRISRERKMQLRTEENTILGGSLSVPALAEHLNGRISYFYQPESSVWRFINLRLRKYNKQATATITSKVA